MKKIFYVFVLSLFFSPFLGISQGITDHNNNDLYTTLNSRCSFAFGSNYASVSVGLFYDSTENAFTDGNGPHSAHSKAVIISLGIVDFNSDLNKFFTQANQPTVTFSVGHAFHSVTNFINWDEARTAKRDFLGAVDRELYLGLFFNKSFITYYDTLRKEISDQSLGNYNSASLLDFDKFITYGFKADYNMYYTRWLTVALTGTVQRGYAQPFADFQNGPFTAYSAQNNVYGANDLAGRVGGDINQRVMDARFSIATPVFVRAIYRSVADLDKEDKAEATARASRRTIRDIWGRLFVMPFFATDGWSNNNWHNEVGGSINFLQTSYGGSNSKIASNEGIGIDWQSGAGTRNGWSGPIYYVVGRLNIGNSPDHGRRKYVARDKDDSEAPEPAPIKEKGDKE